MTFNFIQEGAHVIEVRHGDAQVIHDPVKLGISGNIDTVRLFIEKRINQLEQLKCHLKVYREAKMPKLQLIVNETDHFTGQVEGCLLISKDFADFGINTAKKYSLRDLADFIKMHRHCFVDPSVAMKLVADLKNFKARVNKEIEKMSDSRGNRNDILVQVVDTNIPDSFTLKMPIFKNLSQAVFQVDINILVRDAEMECQLESVEANELFIDTVSAVMDSELAAIRNSAPDLLIVECQ